MTVKKGLGTIKTWQVEAVNTCTRTQKQVEPCILFIFVLDSSKVPYNKQDIR